VKFKKAVEETPHLNNAWRAGLGALRNQDKPRIKAEDTLRLRGSADLDTALRQVDPQSNRWDFAIAYQHANRKHEFIYWVETHTGADNQIAVVLRKKAWLDRWLAGDGRILSQFEREIVWVASGGTSFTQGSTQVKSLATRGLRYSGSVLHIRDRHPTPQ
jgi:hypothetical protein